MALQLTWSDVDSSTIRAVAYCADTHMMGIEFRSGVFYSYGDVAADVYYGLVGASSAGQYFDKVIKKSGLYEYEKFMSREGLENKLMHHHHL